MTPSTPAPADAGALADATQYLQSAYDELCIKFSGVHADDAMDSVLLRMHASLAALRNSAPQETRGDEPVAHMTYNSIKAAFVEYRKTMTVMDKPASFDSYSQGYVAGWNAKEAASHQSPRLDQKTLASFLSGYFPGKQATRDRCADAILALLSPDMTVVSSTDRGGK